MQLLALPNKWPGHLTEMRVKRTGRPRQKRTTLNFRQRMTSNKEKQERRPKQSSWMRKTDIGSLSSIALSDNQQQNTQRNNKERRTLEMMAHPMTNIKKIMSRNSMYYVSYGSRGRCLSTYVNTTRMRHRYAAVFTLNYLLLLLAFVSRRLQYT